MRNICGFAASFNIALGDRDPPSPGIADLCALAPCAKFIHGEGDHCWKWLRRIDGSDLRRAGELEAACARRPTTGRTAFYHDFSGELPWISRRDRRPAVDHEYAPKS